MLTKEMMAVMQAYDDGEKIEARSRIVGMQWRDCNKPRWNWLDSEYRIKAPNKIMVMQAYEAGKEIDVREGDGPWKPCLEPTWNWERYAYRVEVKDLLEACKTHPIQNCPYGAFPDALRNLAIILNDDNLLKRTDLQAWAAYLTAQADVLNMAITKAEGTDSCRVEVKETRWAVAITPEYYDNTTFLEIIKAETWKEALRLHTKLCQDPIELAVLNAALEGKPTIESVIKEFYRADTILAIEVILP